MFWRLLGLGALAVTVLIEANTRGTTGVTRQVTARAIILGYYWVKRDCHMSGRVHSGGCLHPHAGREGERERERERDIYIYICVST